MTTPTTAERLWLTIEATAHLLGVNEKTVRRQIDSGVLPCYRVGTTTVLRIKRTDLDALLTPLVTR